jgi:hypothetical protein
MSLTAHLPWVVGMARWQGSQFDLAQPDGRNQTRATAARRWQTGLQSVAAAVDCSVEHLRACPGAFRPRSRWCLRVGSVLARATGSGNADARACAASRAPCREPATKPVGEPDAGNPHEGQMLCLVDSLGGQLDACGQNILATQRQAENGLGENARKNLVRASIFVVTAIVG